ncbi:MAG: hypothetical protein J6T77_01430, partial [Clostridia bacterium]|nr:hypothetical protein [Clostridia bacterium]
LQYFAWYGLGRGLIEILRTDSLHGLFGEKLFVVVGLASFVICTTLLIIMLVKANKEEKELGAYSEVYSAPATAQNEGFNCEEINEEPENAEKDMSGENEDEDGNGDGEDGECGDN